MAKSKFTDDGAIRQKINDLFAYRKITELLQRSGLDRNKSFMGQLIDVQHAIYVLDAYLESRWELDEGALASHWAAIQVALSRLHFSPRERKDLLKEIQTYEKIEKNCRKDRWPTQVSFKTFYTIKSCDVRLIRHILYDAHPALDQVYHERSWVYYDRITEINDDVADLHEDLLTYNGNRFLISILRKGQNKTFQQYDQYLKKVTKKAKEYFKPRLDRGENKQLFSWTLARAEETSTLLHDTMRGLDHVKLGTSLWLEKMK